MNKYQVLWLLQGGISFLSHSQAPTEHRWPKPFLLIVLDIALHVEVGRKNEPVRIRSWRDQNLLPLVQLKSMGIGSAGWWKGCYVGEGRPTLGSWRMEVAGAVKGWRSSEKTHGFSESKLPPSRGWMAVIHLLLLRAVRGLTWS